MNRDPYHAAVKRLPSPPSRGPVMAHEKAAEEARWPTWAVFAILAGLVAINTLIAAYVLGASP